MKKISLLVLLAAALMLQSCSSSQFAGTATGGLFGGMLGSAIGGIIGGPRGSDIGTVVGAATGAAVGAAATAPDNKNRTDTHSYDSRTNRDRYPAPSRNREYGVLSIENISFDDYNGNNVLESGEPAYLIIDIYNRSNRYVSDVTPSITCSNSSIKISSAATILGIRAGEGIRYRATIRSPRRLQNGRVSFRITLPDGTTRTATVTTRR